MANVSIEGGCTRISNLYAVSPHMWKYHYTTSDGDFTEFFTAPVGTVPKIGDRIVDGVLVPLTTVKSNQDHSKWEHSPPETYGRSVFPTEY